MFHVTSERSIKCFADLVKGTLNAAKDGPVVRRLVESSVFTQPEAVVEALQDGFELSKEKADTVLEVTQEAIGGMLGGRCKWLVTALYERNSRCKQSLQRVPTDNSANHNKTSSLRPAASARNLSLLTNDITHPNDTRNQSSITNNSSHVTLGHSARPPFSTPL